MQSSAMTIVPKQQTSFTELLDNREGIILDLENLHYFTLNSTALFLWKELNSQSVQSHQSLSGMLVRAFNISSDKAENDVSAFLDELSGNGLIFIDWNAGTQPVVEPVIAPEAGLEYETPRLKLSNSLTRVTLSGSSTIATAAIATGGG